MPAEDRYEVLPGGQIKLHLAGKTHTLRRPKIGEQRRLDDSLAEIRAKERDKALWELEQLGEDAAGDVAAIAAGDSTSVPPERLIKLMDSAKRADPIEARKKGTEIEDARVGWWVEEVFPVLAEKPEPLAEIDRDDLPTFLLFADIINQAQAGWMGNGPAPGGS